MTIPKDKTAGSETRPVVFFDFAANATASAPAANPDAQALGPFVSCLSEDVPSTYTSGAKEFQSIIYNPAASKKPPLSRF